MIHDELQLEVLGIERAHRVGNKNNKRNAQRTIVPKLYSYKDKQIVLSVAIKLKGKNQTLKETPVHQSRKTGQKWRDIALFVCNNFDFKITMQWWYWIPDGESFKE